MTELISITEADVCPLSGSEAADRPRREKSIPKILVPVAVLPASTSDAEAEHERAMGRAWSWSREANGTVIVWDGM